MLVIDKNVSIEAFSILGPSLYMELIVLVMMQSVPTDSSVLKYLLASWVSHIGHPVYCLK